MALLVGSRLASHLLAANVGSVAYLPEIYPAVAGIARLHLKVDRATELLRGSERHLVAMGIPYVWATYENLVNATVGILVRGGLTTPTKAEKNRGLMGLHSYVARVTAPLAQDDLDLLVLVRSTRNCIVHAGGATTADVIDGWQALTPTAEARWIKGATRPMDVTARQLDLLVGELVAALAITKHMARELSESVRTAISTKIWAAIAVDDFLANYPNEIPHDPTILRKKVIGWSRMNYSSATIPESEIVAELSSRRL
jgi:hypothetical protein